MAPKATLDPGVKPKPVIVTISPPFCKPVAGAIRLTTNPIPVEELERAAVGLIREALMQLVQKTAVAPMKTTFSLELGN